MENLFLRVLNMSLSAAVVIAAVMLVRLLLRTAPKKWRYLLWSAAGFRLCCPVSFKAVFSLFRLRPSSMAAVGGAENVMILPQSTPAAVQIGSSAAALPSAAAAPITPAAVPGLFIGCLLANILGGAMIPDVIFGSLATLIGAFFTWKLRRASPYLAPIPPILSNTLIIPFVLRYAYLIEMPIPLMMLTIFFGEVISCGLLGILLYFALDKKRDAIFRIDNH